MHFSTDWLMPLDKRNSSTAGARDLISSLINVASSRDVQPQQLQCFHHGATLVPLWSPILSSQLNKVTTCSRHVMASVRDIKIAEALLMLCLAYYVMKRVWLCWNWDVSYGFHVSRYGARVSRVYSPSFPLWLDGLQRCFLYCSLPILLCNRQNIAEYKTYWLMGFPIINFWGARFTSIFCYGWMDCRDTFFMLFFAYTAV